jgi:acetyl-CoA synthetase
MGEQIVACQALITAGLLNSLNLPGGRALTPMSETIATLLHEFRHFDPSDTFKARSNASDPAIYDQAERDYLAWWESWGNKLSWFEPFHTVCQFEAPNAQWFLGGKLNACYNCVDRHAETMGAKVAMIWEGEPGDTRSLTYAEVKREVSRIANGLKALGVKKGDRVSIYMPMVPELPMTMLACARIGAAHSVVFGGFTAESLQERTNDAQAKVIVTADGGWRRGKVVPLLDITAEALKLGCPTVEKVLSLQRVGPGIAPVPAGMDTAMLVRWEELIPQQSDDCPCEPMDSEDLLFILYTSGSTGKPKGIVHTTAGYLTGVTATTKLVFDLNDHDIHFCTADCGWITGHSYIVYGPMSNGATVLLYEGAPDTPDKDRFWRIIEKHGATILYTAPTAIRTFMKWGHEYPERCNLSSLRLLGSVGEPINPEAWVWYHRNIGGGRCPVVDTWWQTETGAIMITPLPGITRCKPGSATQAFPGIRARIYSEEGTDLTDNWKPGDEIGGFLVLDRPWPSMTRGIFNDPDRFLKTYWSRFPGKYFAGDGAKVDDEGYFWLLGRVDDIMLVAGHNISTMEVESALVSHPEVAEAAVIGRQHDLKGQAVAAFVILRAGASHHRTQTDEQMVEEVKRHVASKIGPIARPDDVFLVPELPKTRSGKIMRRLLRDIAEGRALGDTTTLADPTVMTSLKHQYEDKEG